METVSCSIPNSLHFSSNLANSSRFTSKFPKPNLLQLPSISFNFARNTGFPRKCWQLNRFAAFCSSSSTDSKSHDLAVLLEIEGVLIDAYRSGNRQSFNAAFRKLGLDCANWSEPVYSDLLRKNAGDEERMLVMYFNRIGWPTSLPTNEKGTFVKSVLREKKNALDEIMMSESIPLRPGVGDFIDEAYKEGIPVLILTAYFKSGDQVGRSILEKLGQETISKIKIVGNDEVERSLYSQLVQSLPTGVDEQLAKEARKAVSAEKQRIAEEVASKLKLSADINTSSPESMEKIVAALRAGAEYAGLPVNKCVLVAGTQPGVAGASLIGMPCVVLRSSLTSRAEFPSAKATMDGFGAPELTISKLCRKRWLQSGDS